MEAKQIKIKYVGAKLPNAFPSLIDFFHAAPIRWPLEPVEDVFFHLSRALHIEEYLRQNGRRVVNAYTYNGSVRLVVE